MTERIYTKIIRLPFDSKESQSILEEELNSFLEKEKLSLEEVSMTHGFEVRTILFGGKTECDQIYTFFYKKE